MNKVIEYKGRRFNAYVSEMIGNNGIRFTVATVKIGRHECLLTYRLGTWYNLHGRSF